MTVAYAVEPSSLIDSVWKGSSALSTWGPSASSVTAFSMAAVLSDAVTFCPSGAMNTTRAVALSAVAPGKRSSARS